MRAQHAPNKDVGLVYVCSIAFWRLTLASADVRGETFALVHNHDAGFDPLCRLGITVSKQIRVV